MNLYVIGYTPDGKISSFKEALETNSITKINKWIMANPYKDDICFPLLVSADKSMLEEEGKTVLLFSKPYYYLVDIAHEKNVAALRHTNIEKVLN